MTSRRRPEPLLTVQDVAEILRIHPNTVRRWADSGEFRMYRLPGRGQRRFRRSDISRYIRKMRVKLNGSTAASIEASAGNG